MSSAALLTFHPGADALVTGDVAGPPGPPVEFGPHQVPFHVFRGRKKLFLWAVGLTKTIKKH